MIKKLTNEQEKKLPEYAEKFTKIGLSCDPLDFEQAKYWASESYAVAGLEKPKRFLHARSPIECAIIATFLKEVDQVRDQVWGQFGNQVGNQVRNQVLSQVRSQVWDQVLSQVWDQVRSQVWDQVLSQVWDQVRSQVWDQVRSQVRDQVRDQVGSQVGNQVWDQVSDQVWNQVSDQVWDQVSDQVWNQVRNQVYGSMDAHWLGMYEFFQRECGIDCSKLKPLIELSKFCGWWAPYEDLCILQDRPEWICFDENKLLHAEGKPAIRYRDGFAVHAWHGTRLPLEWFDEKMPTAQEMLKWKNIEQRRAGCEIIGWDQILKELKPRIINTDLPEIGTLLEVNLPDSGIEKFLKVQCGTGRSFVIPVPPDVKNALQANAWTYGYEGIEINNFNVEVRT